MVIIPSTDLITIVNGRFPDCRLTILMACNRSYSACDSDGGSCFVFVSFIERSVYRAGFE